MKVEHLLAQFLYNNKKVTLQDIGSFELSPNVVVANDSEKETQLPPGSISFEYDQHARQDENLVDYIVQQTRKIKPLAASDLESFSILGRQFLNIGKPFYIEGIGTLVKSQEGSYEFMQGHTVNARLEAPTAALREKQQDEVDFSSPERTSGSKNNWLVFLVIALIAAAGATAYYYFSNQETETPISQTTSQTDTLVNLALPAAADSAAIKDSLARSLKPADGYSFKVVIKEYPTKAAAEKAYARLTSYGHKLVLSPIDAVRYKLAIPFTSPLSDTLRAKDSLAKFFQGKTYIVLQ